MKVIQHNNPHSDWEIRIIGQTIVSVTYYEINRDTNPFTFGNFDNFDLGINIEFGDGSHWHIAWNENDLFGAGQIRFQPLAHHTQFSKFDATSRWKSYSSSKITSVSMKFIDYDSKQFDQAQIQFEDARSILIVIGEELNCDDSIPNPLNYSENGQIYVLFNEQITDIPERKVSFIEIESEINPRKKRIEINYNQMIGIFIVVVLLIMCFYRYFNNM